MKKILSVFALSILTALSIHSSVNSQETFKDISFDDLEKGINQLKLEDYAKHNFAQYLLHKGLNVYQLDREVEHLTDSEYYKLEESFKQLSDQWQKKFNSLWEQEKYNAFYLIKNEVRDSITNDLSYLALEEISSRSDTEWIEKPANKQEIISHYIDETASDIFRYCEDLVSSELSKQEIKEQLDGYYLSNKRSYEQNKLKYGEYPISIGYDSMDSKISIRRQTDIKAYSITSP